MTLVSHKFYYTFIYKNTTYCNIILSYCKKIKKFTKKFAKCAYTHNNKKTLIIQHTRYVSNKASNSLIRDIYDLFVIRNIHHK